MATAMMKSTTMNVTLMEETAVDHASIWTIARIALALVTSLGMEYPMLLLEMVFAMIN